MPSSRGRGRQSRFPNQPLCLPRLFRHQVAGRANAVKLYAAVRLRILNPPPLVLIAGSVTAKVRHNVAREQLVRAADFLGPGPLMSAQQ